MKLINLLKTSILLLSTFIVISLTSCGGSGGGEDEFTTRPQTLDGIIMRLGGAEFEFVSNFTSPNAVQNSDIQTGAVIYTPGRGDTFEAVNSNVPVLGVWPFSTGSLTYRYQGLGDSTGQITIINPGMSTYVDDIPLVGDQQPHSYLHTANNLVINVDFEARGSRVIIVGALLTSVTSAGTPIKLNNAAPVQSSIVGGVTSLEFDADQSFASPSPDPIDPTAFLSFTQAQMKLRGTNSPVPTNYGTNFDRKEITPEYLTSRVITFTDSSNVLNNFSLQFRSDGELGNPQEGIPQTGSVIYEQLQITPPLTTTESFEYVTNQFTGLSTITLLPQSGTSRTELGVINLTFTSIEVVTPIGVGGSSSYEGTYISSASGNTGTFVVSQPEL